MYPEYSGGLVQLPALSDFEFFFTGSDMLTDAKYDCLAPYGAML